MLQAATYNLMWPLRRIVFNNVILLERFLVKMANMFLELALNNTKELNIIAVRVGLYFPLTVSYRLVKN